jgi:hypothetical protein
MAEDPYVYPGTGTLRNNLGIRDLAELEVAEHTINPGQWGLRYPANGE